LCWYHIADKIRGSPTHSIGVHQTEMRHFGQCKQAFRRERQCHDLA
jgi:hypothetical protein